MLTSWWSIVLSYCFLSRSILSFLWGKLGLWINFPQTLTCWHFDELNKCFFIAYLVCVRIFHPQEIFCSSVFNYEQLLRCEMLLAKQLCLMYVVFQLRMQLFGSIDFSIIDLCSYFFTLLTLFLGKHLMIDGAMQSQF